jgi:hypothetical protein
MISMGKAARQLRVSKATLSKAIATGKLSANRNADGSYAIDPAELARYHAVHGHRFHAGESGQPSTDASTGNNTGSELVELRVLKRVAEERLAELKAALDDMRRERDRWQAQADEWKTQAQRQLATPAPATPDPAKPQSWWRWLRTTG